MTHPAFLLGALLVAAPAEAGAGAVTDPRGASPTVDVLTFNTWGLPRPIAVSRKARFPRIERFVRGLAPDFTGLQEVWRGARALLPMPGLRYPGHDGDSGLAALTHLPVLAQRSHTYVSASGIDRLKDKGALLTTVEHDQLGIVNLVVTHLQAGSGDRSVASRGAQVDELLDLIAGLDGATVLLGDFNLYGRIEGDRDSSARLEAAGFLDAAAAVGATQPTHDSADARLDRVYVRGLAPVDAEVYPTAGLSDHRAVRVKLGPPALADDEIGAASR